MSTFSDEMSFDVLGGLREETRMPERPRATSPNEVPLGRVPRSHKDADAVITRGPAFELDSRADVQIVHLTVANLLDEETAEYVAKKLTRLVDDVGYRKLVIDMAAVQQAGSFMIAKLLGLQRRLVAAGGKMMLCGIRQDLKDKLVDVLRLSLVFHIYSDESEAIAHM
jgi:anti-anti-sigma factor